MTGFHVTALVQVLSVSEYCNRETFTASCDIHEVIVMQHSVYGRMKIGKCVKEDYGLGTIGCSGDVKQTMHDKCSGRRHCEVHVAQLDISLPCLKEMSPYLEASFICRKSK